MITENYIKMCEQAKEIQKLWKPKCGDWCSDPDHDATQLYSIGDAMLKHPIRWNKWLPTLEQLFEIWCNLCGATNFAGICQRIIIYERSKLATYPNIGLVKELSLEVIMKEFYNKVWTGEKWMKKGGEINE